MICARYLHLVRAHSSLPLRPSWPLRSGMPVRTRGVARALAATAAALDPAAAPVSPDTPARNTDPYALLPRDRPRRVAAARGPFGYFTPTRPPAVLPAWSHREALGGGFGGTPYYRLADVFQGPMLPKMQQALDLGREAYTARLWGAFSDAPGAYHGVPGLLDVIGTVLQPGARRETARHPLTGALNHRYMPGHMAFERPLAGSCMLVDPDRVADTHDMWLHDGRYTRVHLGGVEGPGHIRIYESAHRVVTWSMHGPPPPDLVEPVVMHVCNRSDCLHPGHMVWGEDGENFSRHASDYALERRMAQRGY